MNALRLLPFPDSAYEDWLAEETERRFRWQFLPLYHDAPTAHEMAGAVASMAPHMGTTELWRVTDGSRPMGWVWLKPSEVPGGDLLVLDADSDAPVEALLALLVAHAGPAKYLLIDRMEGAVTPTALATAAEMVPTSTNMALELHDAPLPSTITLTPMRDKRFEEWKARNILEYAQEVENSTTADHEAALQASLNSFAELLPDGLATPDQILFDVIGPQGDAVGMLWLARRSPTAYFVYDVVIDEAARGRGLGRAAMNAAAAWSRDQAGKVLALNVFGQNHVARSLYLSLGYRIVVEEMVCDLKHPSLAGHG